MTNISLRSYIREIDSMIEQERLEEAIAHCRHILSKYPKHIDTYRLLGKAYLERNQNSNAADIFQRVLSAVPDDFVSHIGMSLIREEEGNLQAAVMHMERAFEKQPYNNAIQEEIRRLYGKRDGIEPPKVRLTQGALARMYLKGGLISQGIAELRSALSEQPGRFDLRTLLAEAYQDAGHMGKAIEMASTVLKKFPFNLASNRILAQTLKTHDHPEEMAICRKRLYALSPYEAYVSEHAPTVEEVPDRAVEIERLDWSEFEEELGVSPGKTGIDWASALSTKEPAPESTEEEPVPEWLAGMPEEEVEKMEEEIVTEEEPIEEAESEIEERMADKEDIEPEEAAEMEPSPPSPVSEIESISEVEPETPASSERDEDIEEEIELEDKEPIPDWMTEVGWEASEGEPGEPEDIYAEEISTKDEELEPAEIPDWLQEKSPPAEEETPAEVESMTPDEPIPSTEKTEEEAPELQEMDQEGIPDWLTEGPEFDQKESVEDIVEEGPLPRDEGLGMEGIEDEEFAPAAFGEEFIKDDMGDFPDWLRDIKSDEEDQETTVAWLNNLHEKPPTKEEDVAAFKEEDLIEPKPSPESIEDLEELDWIQDLDQASSQPPDWLSEMEEEGEEKGFPSLPLETPEGETTTDATQEEALETPIEDMWEEEPEDFDEDPISKFEMGEGLVSDQIEEEEDEFPDWLAELDKEEEEIPEFELDTEAEEGADFEWPLPSDEVEEEIRAPEEAAEMEPGPPSPESEIEEMPLEEDIPGWLDMLGEEEEEEPFGEPEPEIQDITEEELREPAELEEEPFAEEEEEIPDWLAGVEPTAEEEKEIAPSAVEEPEEELQPIDIEPEPLEEPARPKMDDEDETMAWLESLAAKQGVDEEEFVTSAEERAQVKPPERKEAEGPPEIKEEEEEELPKAEMPEWLSELEPKDKEEVFEEPLLEEEEQAVEEPSAEPSMERPPESLEELETEEEGFPDWLGELEKEEEREIEEPAPVSDETKMEPPSEEKKTEEEEGISVPSAFEEIEEEDMAWLESLAQTGDLNLDQIIPSRRKKEDITPTPKAEADERGLPDWFSELEAEERETRDEDMFAPEKVEEEVEPFKEEEKEETADWLAELETAEDEAREFIEAKDAFEEEALTEAPPSEGMLKRLGEEEQEEVAEEEVPDWLVDFKEEEDPQETAVLWLRRFVEKGKDVDVEEEIRRYTDELDSEEIPEWMEDLKKEEDPTSTAMLWLNRLEQEGRLQKQREAEDFDESSWIAELEEEQERLKSKEESAETEEFEMDEGGWLADLEREESVEPDIEKEKPFVEAGMDEGESDQEETPPWMLATSPLEGVDLTSDLTKEDEEEIPEWLAGYEEEEPEEEEVEEAEVEEDEYAWLSAYGDEKAPPDEVIDLNKAAISQLESIIGISYQIAEGIVTYREEHGPFQTYEDLKNVPEIKDDQIIEIFRSEVALEIPEAALEKEPKEEVKKKVEPAVEDTSQNILQTAREKLSAGEIESALSDYEKLIDDKESIDEVIEDLSEASYDHPMDVSIIKTLGDAYMSIDKLQEALDAYSKAEDLLR